MCKVAWHGQLISTYQIMLVGGSAYQHYYWGYHPIHTRPGGAGGSGIAWPRHALLDLSTWTYYYYYIWSIEQQPYNVVPAQVIDFSMLQWVRRLYLLWLVFATWSCCQFECRSLKSRVGSRVLTGLLSFVDFYIWQAQSYKDSLLIFASRGYSIIENRILEIT